MGAAASQTCFYEDNLMIYQTIPYVRKMYYLNADLYRYWIAGRISRCSLPLWPSATQIRSL